MKTQLPTQIKTVKQAKFYLTDLIMNNEEYHPEDNAEDIIWADVQPTILEAEHMNNLMDQIYALGNFDPCEFIMDFDRDNI